MIILNYIILDYDYIKKILACTYPIISETTKSSLWQYYVKVRILLNSLRASTSRSFRFVSLCILYELKRFRQR